MPAALKHEPHSADWEDMRPHAPVSHPSMPSAAQPAPTMPRNLRDGRSGGFSQADTALWATPEAALALARVMYRNTLGSWAMDVLRLRHRGQHLPRTSIELAAPVVTEAGV